MTVVIVEHFRSTFDFREIANTWSSLLKIESARIPSQADKEFVDLCVAGTENEEDSSWIADPGSGVSSVSRRIYADRGDLPRAVCPRRVISIVKPQVPPSRRNDRYLSRRKRDRRRLIAGF